MGLKTDNLVCYYNALYNQGVHNYNENATTWKDLSGNMYDGTIHNCTWEDGGLRIPGSSSSYVTTSYNGHIAKNITVECVFEIYSIHSALSYIVYNATNGWTMELGTSNQITPSLYLNSSWKNDTRIQVAQTNKRYFFTFTYDGNVIRSYMNGSLINTNTYSNTSITDNGNGNMSFGNSATFNGKIFGVRIYDTVLTPNEIIDNFVYDYEMYKSGAISQEVSKVHTTELYNIKDEKARLEKIDRYVDGKATAVVNFLNGIQINGGKIYYDSTKDTVYFE
jgi:hypothetical protein